MADTIRVIYKPAGKRYEIRRIPNTLEACQGLVGGYIEPVTVCTDLVLVCNEEGRNLGLAPNPFLGYDFRGDWFLCGRDGEEFADVPEWDAAFFQLGGYPDWAVPCYELDGVYFSTGKGWQ